MKLTKEMAEGAVDTIMATYPALEPPDGFSEEDHFTHIAAIYGELIEGPPADEQMQHAGAMIAVLFWKLAKAQGKLAPRVQAGDNLYAQTPEQADAVNHFIETGEAMPGAGQAYL